MAPFAVLCVVVACEGKSPVSNAVVSPVVVGVAVAPQAASIAVGGTQQLQATALGSNGVALTNASFTWATSDATVATVSATGLVTGVAAGTAQISATSSGQQGQATVVVLGSSGGGGGAQGNIVVNTGAPQQMMAGWEGTAQAGQGTPAFPSYRDSLFSLVADLGIDRVRVAVRAGIENPTDYWTQFKQGQFTEAQFKCLSYTVVNDDSDPNHINPAGFHFSELDSTIEQVVLPLQQKLAAAGRRLYVNANYTAFTGSCSGSPAATHANPAEYAEFALATFQHLQQKYGLVPDYWEMILEPDNSTPLGNGTLIGQALVATAAKLAAAGFHPMFIAPSTMQASNAPTYFAEMQAVPGAPALVTQLSYHRYGVPPTPSVLAAIAQLALQYGLQTAMLERIGATYQDLQDDLEKARVSSWQQFTLAFPGGTDNGGTYFMVDASNPSQPRLRMGDRTRYLRQYFHYVRPGAVRVDATSTAGGADPVAFVNPDGHAVVVVRTTGAATLTIQGLPAGTYGIHYTTANATDVALPDQVITAGQLVQAAMAATGVITIYGK